MPGVNKVTIGIMAVLAQDERERISQRTKVTLAELQKRGKKLGTPANLTPEARLKGLVMSQRNTRENENNRKAAALIKSLRNVGMSFYRITQELNSLGFKTRRRKEFQQIQVWILFIGNQLT